MTAQEDAARWFAVTHRRLMTVDEHAAYERWLTEDANKSAMAEMENIWGMLEGVRGQIFDAVPDARAGRTSPRVVRKIMVAAMSVVAIGVSVLSFAGHTTFWTSLDWTNR